MNIPTHLLTPQLIRQIADQAEAAEKMKPAIMTAYRRLERTLNLTGSKARVFSLLATSMLHAYQQGQRDGNNQQQKGV